MQKLNPGRTNLAALNGNDKRLYEGVKVQMKIGLMDVDGHNFPNLALMKLSNWHKAKGDMVEWCIPMDRYDRVYMAKVFDFTPDINECIQADEIIKGGTGYDLKNKLPADVEKMFPDYSLYDITDTAYGYLTRGCPRGCPFCIVAAKEGLRSYRVADLSDFWSGQRYIKLLDPNLLACKQREYLLRQLIDSKAKVDFTQGLDIRLMTPDITELIKQLRLKMVHFAWDREKDSDIIIRNLEIFKKTTGIDRRKATVYVLTNFETEFEFDLYRVYKLKELGYDPYIMIYDRDNAPHRLKKMQRWVNNKIIFMSCDKFEDYSTKIG